MNSLRRRLALALIIGYAWLLGAGGLAVFHFTSAALTQQFDDALLGKATSLTLLVRQAEGRIEFNFPDHAILQPGTVKVLEYFQLWRIGGETIYRSITVGSQDLPRRYSSLSQPDYFNLELPGGIPGRAVGIRFPLVPRTSRAQMEDGPPPEIGLVAAISRHELDQQIDSLAYNIVIAGSIVLLASLIVVDLILWGGLKKLSRVTEQAQQIGIGSLQKRFPTKGMTTELSPICHALNDLLDRLEHAFTELNQYAGKVAHELRTPLAILRLKIEQGGNRISPDLAEELNAEIHQIAHVVDQSLLIARAEQGRIQTQACTFDLAELLSDATEDFSLVAKESDRQLQFKIGASPARVCADPQHTRQIVHNLLSNAWKHGRGKIRLHLVGHSGRKRVAISVINQTPGFPAAASSSGLGLRVVDTLIRLQPGMTCKRRSGKGYYSVRLTFPQSPVAP